MPGLSAGIGLAWMALTISSKVSIYYNCGRCIQKLNKELFLRLFFLRLDKIQCLKIRNN